MGQLNLVLDFNVIQPPLNGLNTALMFVSQLFVSLFALRVFLPKQGII